jgi:hypothetical protein
MVTRRCAVQVIAALKGSRGFRYRSLGIAESCVRDQRDSYHLPNTGMQCESLAFLESTITPGNMHIGPSGECVHNKTAKGPVM